MRNQTCNCWVRTRPQEEQAGLRWGAHSITCPRYRIGLDPVDRIKDELNRIWGETQQRVN